MRTLSLTISLRIWAAPRLLAGPPWRLRMPATGQEMAYPLSKLDAASQQQAKDSAQ